jgi:hypothetical protein
VGLSQARSGTDEKNRRRQTADIAGSAAFWMADMCGACVHASALPFLAKSIFAGVPGRFLNSQ